MKSNYEVRAKKFIHALYPYVRDCSDFDDYELAVEKLRDDYPNRKILFSHGMTRVVFITSDYVIKIDYSPSNISYLGGCEAEMKLYRIAEQEGMSHLFAKISRYDYNGMTFYIMPRVNNIHEEKWVDAIYYMTEEEEEWCEQHKIYDLHSSNYGFYNKHVVVFDYACYAEME